MTMNRRMHSGQDEPGDVLDALLRDEFYREIGEQRDRLPSAELILLAAKLNARIRCRVKSAALECWAELIVLCTLAALLSLGWNDVTAGLETFFPWVSADTPWAAGVGLASALLVFSLCWARGLLGRA